MAGGRIVRDAGAGEPWTSSAAPLNDCRRPGRGRGGAAAGPAARPPGGDVWINYGHGRGAGEAVAAAGGRNDPLLHGGPVAPPRDGPRAGPCAGDQGRAGRGDRGPGGPEAAATGESGRHLRVPGPCPEGARAAFREEARMPSWQRPWRPIARPFAVQARRRLCACSASPSPWRKQGKVDEAIAECAPPSASGPTTPRPTTTSAGNSWESAGR